MLSLLASLLLAQASSAATAETVTAPSSPCATDAHRQFDFWVGEWDVYPNGSEQMVARSSIQSLHNGCAIREQWMPLQGSGGSSLNNLDSDSGRWQQVWVGSGGGRVEFEGGLVGDAMVLNGYWANINGPGQHGLVRMTYTPDEEGSVRQHGEVSYDHGLSWADSFDFIYRPRTR